MQRDKALRDLSSEHHQALALARDIKKTGRSERETEALHARIRTVFEQELLPHFEIEERAILPALSEAGEEALVEKTLADHVGLKQLIAQLEQPGDAERFADALKAHVRFEERELFEVCQRVLDAQTMNRISHSIDEER